jgi:hypothetical protein
MVQGRHGLCGLDPPTILQTERSRVAGAALLMSLSK